MPNTNVRHADSVRTLEDTASHLTDPPFREYIGSMARQLAQLARAECGGDESLAVALERAAQLAAVPRE